MKYLFIYNPHSGTKSNNEKLLEGARKLLEQHGHSVAMKETEAENHATEIAKEAIKSDVDVVVAVGGDGTVNEIALALTGSDKILGIIPNGSGNGLARELRIPMNPKQATETLLRHQVAEIDTCTANGNPFFVTCSVGFDASVTEEFASSDTRGLATYVKEAVSLFFSYEPEEYRIVIDGEEVRTTAFLVAVGNASQYGNNAFIAPNASMTDGLLDITVIKDFPMIDGGKIALQLFSKDLDKSEYTMCLQGKEITISASKKMPYQIDGEPMAEVEELKVALKPQKLRVVIGREEDREKTIFDYIKSITGKMTHALS